MPCSYDSSKHKVCSKTDWNELFFERRYRVSCESSYRKIVFFLKITMPQRSSIKPIKFVVQRYDGNVHG